MHTHALFQCRASSMPPLTFSHAYESIRSLRLCLVVSHSIVFDVYSPRLSRSRSGAQMISPEVQIKIYTEAQSPCVLQQFIHTVATVLPYYKQSGMDSKVILFSIFYSSNNSHNNM